MVGRGSGRIPGTPDKPTFRDRLIGKHCATYRGQSPAGAAAITGSLQGDYGKRRIFVATAKRETRMTFLRTARDEGDKVLTPGRMFIVPVEGCCGGFAVSRASSERRTRQSAAVKTSAAPGRSVQLASHWECVGNRYCCFEMLRSCRFGQAAVLPSGPRSPP